MSTEITVAFVQQYRDNVILLAQQKGSILRDKVRTDYEKGKAYYFERVGATTAQKKVTRHGDTPLINTPHSRRRITPFTYEWADLVDDADKVRMLIKPESTYAQNAAFAMGRAIDDAIIEAFYSNAYAGEDGSTTVPLPSAQKVAQDGTPSSITLAKLIAARTVLQKSDIDLEDPRHCVISPTAMGALLNVAEVKSSDYNTNRVLVNGRVQTWMGYDYSESNRLPLVTTGTYRASYIWCQSGVGLMVADDVKTKISERADKSYSVQVFVSMDIGATRIEDEKVVEIPCLATD
jgi:hypothetical protein